MEPGRYLQKYYRSTNFLPAAAVYQVEIFPVEQVSGLRTEQGRILFNEELLQALTANGLKVSQADSEWSRPKSEAQPEGSKTDRTKPEVSLGKPNSPEKSAALVTLSGVVERLWWPLRFGDFSPVKACGFAGGGGNSPGA